MADKKTMSDEDYLDSLLKSITESESSKDESYKDKDESDFAKALEEEIGLKDDEDSFLNDIENDLFANGEVLSDAGQEEGDEDNSIDEINDYDALSDNIDISDDLNVAEIDDKQKKKKTKRGLFGRNKKIVISDDSGNTDENKANTLEAGIDLSNDTNVSEDKTDIPDNTKITEDTDKETQDAGDYDDFSLDLGNDFATDYNDNFDLEFDDGNDSKSDDTLSDDTENQVEETPENQISDLMDIMGIANDSEEADNEENKGKSKKKKKEKAKNKKGLFSKHKKEKDTQSESDSDFDNSIADTNNPAQADSTIDSMDISNTGEQSNDVDMFNLDSIASNAEADDYSFGLDMDFGGDEESQELDENENLIRQMDRGEIDEEEILNEEEKEGKKKKKEKKKKEKKPKKQKVKKVKKPKVKKPKEPDEIIPVPKVLLIFSFSFIVLLVVCLIFGGNLKYYNDKMQRATTFYVNKDYEAAYGEVSGLSIKEKDQDFYNQVFTVMLVSHQYTAGKNLLAVGDYEQALHSYLKGIAMYDKYQNQARDLNCLDEMNGVLEQLNKELNDTFGLTESKARELNLLDNKEEYAYNVKVLAKKIMEKNQEENNDSNN